MLTLAQYKKQNKKCDIRVMVRTNTHWDYDIDSAIKELRDIKKENRPYQVRMELDREYDYSDGYPALYFYITRKETNKEYEKRVQQQYAAYVQQEEYKLKIYKKLKAELEK
ncbi:MAG: hypothetical protein KKD44_27965 [Proteobacteria bacterium]|nr:hypothetical protein [Pseudomonadota bacterium]